MLVSRWLAYFLVALVPIYTIFIPLSVYSKESDLVVVKKMPSACKVNEQGIKSSIEPSEKKISSDIPKFLTKTTSRVEIDFTNNDPTPEEVKAQVVTDKPNSLDSEKIFQLINKHRVDIGLTPYEKDEKLCELARSRGPELSGEAQSGAIHAGFNARNLPYWITENMKYGSNEQGTYDWWMGSTIHRRAIEADYKYSCGECWGDACIELFTSYQPK